MASGSYLHVSSFIAIGWLGFWSSGDVVVGLKECLHHDCTLVPFFVVCFGKFDVTMGAVRFDCLSSLKFNQGRRIDALLLYLSTLVLLNMHIASF